MYAVKKTVCALNHSYLSKDRRHCLVFTSLVFVSWVVLAVTQRPSVTARRNVAACCPNNGQWVAAAGRGGAQRLFQPSNFFFIKRSAVLSCVSSLSYLNIYPPSEGLLLSVIFPSLSQTVVIFPFPPLFVSSQNCTIKTATPSRRDFFFSCRHVFIFLRPATNFSTLTSSDKWGLLMLIIPITRGG